MKKKVAIIVCAWPPQGGGIGNNAYYHAKNLASSDYLVEVFTPKYRSTKVVQENFPVNYLNMWPRLGMAGFLFSLPVKLAVFDIVHLYYPFFGTDLLVWLYKKLNPAKKLIIHYQMDPIGQGWQKIFFKVYIKLFLGLMVSAADKVIILSLDHGVNSYLAKFIKKFPEKFVAIPNGIDAENFKSQPRDESLAQKFGLGQEKVIIFAGGLDKQHFFKGVDILLEAFQKIVFPPMPEGVAKQRAGASEARVDECDPGSIQRCPGPTRGGGRYKLIIAGDGDLKSHYQKMACDFGIVDRVIFVGWINNSDLPKYYGLADVFVLPSTARTESFGIVTAEAQACGLPAVVSNWPGSRMTIENGQTGFLVEPGSTDDLSRKISQLLTNENLRKSFGEMASARARQLYGWDKIILQIMDLYEKL